MKVVIVGGVAAGAGAAARLRRLDENAQIVLLERGEYISYANCGLPYHLGGVIAERERLLVIPAAKFAERFRVEVRTGSEAVALDPAAKTLTVRHGGETYQESYDQLLLATGSSPIVMELPGSDPERVFQFWTIPDLDRVLARVEAGAKSAVVVGAGFIGLEVAENLRKRGVAVTVVELAGQVLPTVDPEMSSYLAAELQRLGVALELGRKVTAFEQGDDYRAVLDDGRKIPADLVVMSVGVRPNSDLARAAGLRLGARGHIVVDSQLRTSAEGIFAAGDVIELPDPISGAPAAVPLAGPANRQARIAADNLAGGHSVYRGSYGTAVIQIGGLTAASVGWTERRLQAQKLPYRKIYTHPGSNASYYPGGSPLHLKLLFAPDGRILGAQAVGARGADKRVDVIATAMRRGCSAPELAELETAYAPPYNSAKDPVNYLGMVAGNVLSELSDPVYVEALPEGAQLVDVREPEEFATGSIPGALNLPLGQLRERLAELDPQRPVVTFCQVGLRGYLAERILKQRGFRCGNLSGGMLTYRAVNFKLAPAAPVAPPPPPPPAGEGRRTLDVRALACPGPVVRLRRELDELPAGGELHLLASSSFAPDLTSWLQASGQQLLGLKLGAEELEAVIRKRPAAAGPASSSAPTGNGAGKQAAIILFSNDFDKVTAALIVACGMAASGTRVSIFFTFWGLSVLRRESSPAVRKSLLGKMFGFMLPRGVRHLALSRMNFGGAGTALLKGLMAKHGVPATAELLSQARELGVRFIACEMAMQLLGLSREELIEVDEVAGVARFAELARNSGTSLFI